MEKKYKLADETIMLDGRTLHRREYKRIVDYVNSIYNNQ